jgi:branched-chain amino acid transport system ATP-binding protein
MSDRAQDTSLIAARQLTAGYGDLPAVRGLDLAVNPGEVVALLGPNGAGKSTTLLTLAGELPLMSGEVRFLGKTTTLPLYRRAQAGLAFVPEEKTVVNKMSTEDNLKLGSGGVAKAVEFFPELGPLMNRPAGLLSGGEQQMLILARALGASPKVLLADELSLGLAPIIVNRLMMAIRTVADEKGVGVLLVEQQARRVLAVADRWYLLRQGVIVSTGDRNSSRDDLEAAYFSANSSSQHKHTS